MALREANVLRQAERAANQRSPIVATQATTIVDDVGAT
jgi:hypothetical protein